MSIRPFCVLVAGVVCLAAPPFAQTPQQSPPGAQSPQQPPATPEQKQPPTFRTEANFVRVDVFATQNGTPVTDLKRDDFQVFEDGKPQTLSTFEYVNVRTGVPQEERREPNTIRESREALRNPRARVFVLFLDVPHVSIQGSWTIREPLIRLVDRLMGPEDLVGIMTPRMAASDVVFARKTSVIEGGLRERWPWGERHTVEKDELEKLYEACYPWPATAGVVAEMTARKRERATLEALYDLVGWLRDQREERKAIVTVTEGWPLFGRNASLTNLRVIDPITGQTEPVPGPEPIGVGPDGRLRVGDRDSTTTRTKTECDRDRVRLSEIDDRQFLRDLIDAANRSNATFYTVEPRGLVAMDSPIGPRPPPPPHIDNDILKRRHDALHELAHNTDGFPVLNSNDLDKGLRRISDDLSSYYLLGYYSSNTKLDGRFRTLKVDVKRPGIEVRARRGYKAATAAEVSTARAAAAAPVPESVAVARGALEALGRIRAGAAFSAHGVALKHAATTVWVAGELAQPAAAPASAVLTITTAGATNSTEVSIAAGQRGFVTSVPLKAAATGPIDIRVRVSTGDGRLPLTDAVRIDAATAISTPLMFRRGPATGNRQEPVGQPQFSRTERARFEVALDGDAAVTAARVLDRNGNATSIPATIADRADPSGQRWGTAELILAALAPGDYIVEISGKAAGAEQQVRAAFRVVR